MMGKTRVLIVAAVAGIAALIGAEAYHVGQSTGYEKAQNVELDQQTSMQTPQAQPQVNWPPANSVPGEQTAGAPSSLANSEPPVTVPRNYPPATNHVAPGPVAVETPTQGYATSDRLWAETPKVATTYVAPSETVVDRQVVYRNRPVYRTHVVVRHHRKSGKVHVARAAKHTASFIAKLPGRMRL